MLTLSAILKATRHMTSYGEGAAFQRGEMPNRHSGPLRPVRSGTDRRSAEATSEEGRIGVAGPPEAE